MDTRWARRRVIFGPYGRLVGSGALTLVVCATGQASARATHGEARPESDAVETTERAAPRLQPRLDDLFGDAVTAQTSVDRALGLSGSLRKLSDDFARAVHEALAEVAGKGAAASGCPAGVARPYARAYQAGQGYLKIGRELARHHALVRDMLQFGDVVGLTPEYRARAQQVVAEFTELQQGYREMKATFYGQLANELRFSGCATTELLAKNVPGGGSWDGDAVLEATPQPETKPDAKPEPKGETQKLAQAPVAGPLPRPPSSISIYIDSSRCSRRHFVYVDGAPLATVEAGRRETVRTTAGPHELCLLSERPAAPDAKPNTNTDAKVTAGAATLGLNVAHASKPATPTTPPSTSPDAPPTATGCDAPGTVRRTYLHEGWTMALRCD